MMFLDYKPLTNNTCAFRAEVAGWLADHEFNNLAYKDQRLMSPSRRDCFQTRADINKTTSGALNADMYLRIPAGYTPVLVITNVCTTCLRRRITIPAPVASYQEPTDQ